MAAVGSASVGGVAELSQVPLLYQPGEAWLYDTCSAVQGVLIARVSGQSLPDFLAERVFGPLGMARRRRPGAPAR